MSSINRTVRAPKNFKANSIISFISDCQIIFKLVNKLEKGFLLDLGKVNKPTMIGVLLVYKIIEFSSKNNCFVEPMYLMSPSFTLAMEKYGFTRLIISYFSDKGFSEKEFKNLKISVSDDFIIAPQALLRNDKYSAESLNKKYLPKIQQYYSSNSKVVSMIFLCFSEILLNFWEHAVDDTQSIIVANGNKSNIEIACADNGKGIISTLGLSISKGKTKLETLKSAVQKGITSKEMTNHMGYGLWIIDEVIRRTRGRLHLYSEGCYYQREFGKTTSGECGYWQGTIVYISIPVINPVTLSDIENPEENSNFNLKINWL